MDTHLPATINEFIDWLDQIPDPDGVRFARLLANHSARAALQAWADRRVAYAAATSTWRETADRYQVSPTAVGKAVRRHRARAGGR